MNHWDLSDHSEINPGSDILCNGFSHVSTGQMCCSVSSTSKEERAEAKLQSFNARDSSVMAARKARNDAEAKVDELSLVVQDLQERLRKAEKRLLIFVFV